MGGDETQRLSFSRRGEITCEPATFTLNLNLFKKSVLEAIGGLNENYLASFAEPILTVKIRNLGYRVVMLGGARIYHYDRLTKVLGKSTLASSVFEADGKRWETEYSQIFPRHPAKINCALWKRPFWTTWSAQVCWWMAMNLPGAKLRNLAWTFVSWLEPFLTRYPAGEFVQSGFSSEGLSERFYLGYGSESWRSGFIIGHFPDRRLFHSDELRAGKVHDLAQDTV